MLQPTLYAINSTNDNCSINGNPATIGFYNSFKYYPPISILNAKTIQLAKAIVPNISPSFSDSQLVFWYYKLPAPTTAISAQYLQCVRLQPSFIPRDIIPINIPQNRVFDNYPDLLTSLLEATSNDTNNPFFIENDITFNYDPLSKKFSFNGNNAIDQFGDILFFYIVAGYQDPNVAAAAQILNLNTQNPFGLQGFPGQPYHKNQTLNRRLGFTYSGLTPPDFSLYRPVPNYNDPTTMLSRATTATAQTYANLVFSQVVRIFTNLTVGNAYNSDTKPNLLSSIPMDTDPLGVAFYIQSMDTPIKCPKHITLFEFSMETEEGIPFYLPFSANLLIELKIECSPLDEPARPSVP